MPSPNDSTKYRVFKVPVSDQYIVSCTACGWAESYDQALLITLDVGFLRRQALQHICNPKLEVE